MKKILTVLLTLIFSCSVAHAGVRLSMSGKMSIVNLDKMPTPPTFDLTPLREKVKKGEPFKEDIESIAHAQKLWVVMDEIITHALIVDGDDKLARTLEAAELSENGGGFTFGEIEVEKIADRIYKQIVSSSTVADIDAFNGILYQIVEKARMKQSFKAEAKELERIREIIHQARIKAEEVLTKEELAAMLEACNLTFEKAREQVARVLDEMERRQTRGAMVFCGSEIIEVIE